MPYNKNRTAHAGQAWSAPRKRARQRANNEEVQQTAATRGITPTALRRERHLEGQAIIASATLHAKNLAATFRTDFDRWRLY